MNTHPQTSVSASLHFTKECHNVTTETVMQQVPAVCCSTYNTDFCNVLTYSRAYCM